MLKKFFKKRESTNNDLSIQIENYDPNDFYSPLNGTLISLNNVDDPVFSQGMMGCGIAIKPKDGKLFSPVKGKIQSLFPTKHAIGIVDERNNIEILIHIGINTVELNGELFETFVNVNDNVLPGQLLIKFDEKKILEKGYDNVTMIIFTNIRDENRLSNIKYGEVKAGEQILKLL